jgi:hypothetical protein
LPQIDDNDNNIATYELRRWALQYQHRKVAHGPYRPSACQYTISNTVSSSSRLAAHPHLPAPVNWQAAAIGIFKRQKQNSRQQPSAHQFIPQYRITLCLPMSVRPSHYANHS